MKSETRYLSIQSEDMSELTDILLNSVLSSEQRSRAQACNHPVDRSYVVLVYREECQSIAREQPSNQFDEPRITIERLIFGADVSRYKVELATLIFGLGNAPELSTSDLPSPFELH